MKVLNVTVNYKFSEQTCSIIIKKINDFFLFCKYISNVLGLISSRCKAQALLLVVYKFGERDKQKLLIFTFSHFKYADDFYNRIPFSSRVVYSLIKPSMDRNLLIFRGVNRL